VKVASFTVHATAAQSARWKQVAQAEGFPLPVHGLLALLTPT
jgi:hypothetical protein